LADEVSTSNQMAETARRQIWRAAIEQLRTDPRASAPTHAQWLVGSELASLDETAAVVTARSTFGAGYLAAHLSREVGIALAAVTGEFREVRFVGPRSE
jgi:hypothetical protein